MNNDLSKKIEEWLSKDFDVDTRNEIENLRSTGNEKELYDRFYMNLEFGTGGLRGKMGAGSNRMNIYTVGLATQGLADYIRSSGENVLKKGVVIAHDSRKNSHLFALQAARVLAANNIKTYLFKELRPVPLLSFAVRHLGTAAGVVITASHNPPVYNGYKVYWEDGAQITPPHDKNIINHVNRIIRFQDIKIISEEEASRCGLVQYLSDSVDAAYLKAISSLSLNPENNKRYSDLLIAYSPLHGSGITLVEKALQAFGFKKIILVESQKNPDGDFPTVTCPNPEEEEAMSEVMSLARTMHAEIALATDPDADRIGVAARNSSGNFELLSGNQIASLLAYYVLSHSKKRKTLDTKKDFLIKTIVTTDLISKIASDYGVRCFETLTGFKWIGRKIKELQDDGPDRFLYGGEESYGYLLGSFVRDKDAIVISALLVETAAFARSQGKTLFSLLDEIYEKYGFYYERLKYLTFDGFEGVERINTIMNSLRNKTPDKIAELKIAEIIDYQKGIGDLPPSNVLLLILDDGTKIFARPSGTEPKIKFYFMTHSEPHPEGLKQTCERTKKSLARIIDAFLSYTVSL